METSSGFDGVRGVGPMTAARTGVRVLLVPNTSWTRGELCPLPGGIASTFRTSSKPVSGPPAAGPPV